MSRRAAYVVTIWLPVASLLIWGCASAQTSNLNPLQLAPDHATAVVADLDKESRWYQSVLGFREANRFPGPDFELRQMSIPGYRIDLVWQKVSSRPHPAPGSAQQGWLHVVFHTAAIDDDYKRLTEQHTDVKANKDDQGQVMRLLFHDPEGNELEIVRQQPNQRP